MSRHHPLPDASIAAQARAALAELAMAARHGALGAGTILAYTARLDRHLRTLAEYEAVLDEQTQEALDEQRARDDALAAGQVVAFPPRPRLHTGGGGRAA